MNNKEEQTMIEICPSCGKPLKIEQTGGEEDFLHCAEIFANPATIPTGTRVMADQAKLLFVDGNMHEYTREDYIKNNGIDPLPIWRAIEKWREEQIIKKEKSTVKGLKHDYKYTRDHKMPSIETRYGEMDFYIDPEGKIHIHFTENEIREQEQLKKESQNFPTRSEYW